MWPTAFRDVTHTGHSPFAGPTSGRLRWLRQLGANITPGPVIGADGVIYIATNGGELHALESTTGVTRWVLDGAGPAAGDLSISPAIHRSGLLLCPTASGTLDGVDVTGRRRWSLDLPATPTSPMPSDGRVYLAGRDGSLSAVELTDDGVRPRLGWTVDIGPGSYASAAVGPDGTIAVTADHELVLVRDDGDRPTILWRADLGTLSEISPAFDAHGSVIAGGNDHRIQVFAASGARLLEINRTRESYSSPVVTDGIVVQGNHRAEIVAGDLATGARRVVAQRRIKQPGRSVGIWTSPVLDAAANVYVGTRSGRIVGVTWTGELLFDIDAGVDATIDSYPALSADGALIVGDTNGVLRAVADDGALPADATPA